jgi:hypothetical protein
MNGFHVEVNMLGAGEAQEAPQTTLLLITPRLVHQQPKLGLNTVGNLQMK